jgi:hypothetical protein
MPGKNAPFNLHMQELLMQTYDHFDSCKYRESSLYAALQLQAARPNAQTYIDGVNKTLNTC